MARVQIIVMTIVLISVAGYFADMDEHTALYKIKQKCVYKT